MTTKKVWVNGSFDGIKESKLFIRYVDPEIELDLQARQWLVDLGYKNIEIYRTW
ncbi:hypothetical protein Elgi_37210 [Paenibacillus elgii]|uniref:hypothetical protein n=1 Tax=Paenibacillus elgii TaxID=189691 RepID=UPI002D7BB6EE|nr:hypothetical protein Elgi_37210 [Paenibacillus elgii]